MESQRFSQAQVLEFFHLAFLQVLQARLKQERYVVKGGANLRYFFESVRYSEDIDLDAVEVEPWRLEEKVDEVLASPPLRLLLRTGGLEVHDVRKPKQTKTTQRWKTSIAVGGRRSLVSTKIEFSHRIPDPRRVLDAVREQIVAPYALRPPTMQHYTADAATEQKVLALAQRSQTQARDVFDLELLLRRSREALWRHNLDPNILELAVQRALELSFEAFRDQVVPFLDRDVAELYDRPTDWQQMQTFVADRLTEGQ